MAQHKDIVINLLEKDTKKAEKTKNTVLTILLIIILLGGMGYAYMNAGDRLAKVEAENEQLKVKYARPEKVLQQIEANQEHSQMIAAKRSLLEQVQGMQLSCQDALDEIEKALPARVVVIDMLIDEDKISIDGFFQGYEQGASFLSGLRESSMFNNINMSTSIKNGLTGEVKFMIEMDWGDRK